MSKRKERALLSFLIVAMEHIIKWIIQPAMRSASWIGSINNAREEIGKLLKRAPSLKRLIEGLWDKAFSQAKNKAEKEMNRPADNVKQLTWYDVFERIFRLGAKDNPGDNNPNHKPEKN